MPITPGQTRLCGHTPIFQSRSKNDCLPARERGCTMTVDEWLDKKIAAILEEERRPGGLVERYRAALTERMDRNEFEQLVWERYNRLEQEAFMPYWNRHCRWAGEPGNRWIYNDIFKKWWYDYTGSDMRYPPGIGDDTG